MKKHLRLPQPAAGEAGVRVTSHGLRHFAVKQVQASSSLVGGDRAAYLRAPPPGDEDRTRNVLDAALSPPLADASQRLRP